ncbi:hypothetical protein [Chromobacterium violaceum]|uniref:hypothetical protein n=1 Tax=Chromobacterium violaceum TaxID=536 RepID=UPI001B32DCCB|nr:hypothetical protein [Chromobacterium violaceum]MBP4047627.1 hypothetical protein [Chromobacterium violaceum]
MRRTICSALLLCLSCVVQAAVDSETRCFVADRGGKTIRLQFTEVGDPDAGWVAAYVRYDKRSQPITLVWLRSEQEELAAGRPFQFTEEWLEIVRGRINGRYTTIHQGANYYGFHYHGVDGRDIDFDEDMAALNAARQRCEW